MEKKNLIALALGLLAFTLVFFQTHCGQDILERPGYYAEITAPLWGWFVIVMVLGWVFDRLDII